MAEIIYPIGLAPLGTFDPTPGKAPARHPNTIVDNIDPQTGELASMTEVLHPVDANVVFQFRVVFGSGAAVASVGHRFREITKVTDTTARMLEGEARRLLEPFVERRHIKIQRVLTAAAPSGASDDTGAVLVEYTNLLSGRRDRRVRSLS